MNVVRLSGGLGNQMFQYAFGCALKGDVAYDVSWFDECRKSGVTTVREYGLPCFCCEPRLVDAADAPMADGLLRRLFCGGRLREVREFPENAYSSRLLKARDSLISGYFQVARYCEMSRPRLLREFTLRIVPADEAFTNVLNGIASCNSVSVHVRRGDYLALSEFHPVCDASYYARAAEWMRAETGDCAFYVFSDDLEWCRAELKLPGKTTFVDLSEAGRPELDMMLMRACRHNIIANSSFSWWGAWLNEHPGRRVVAPVRWFGGREPEIVPESWRRM